jgi:hypothetical protein
MTTDDLRFALVNTYESRPSIGATLPIEALIDRLQDTQKRLVIVDSNEIRPVPTWTAETVRRFAVDCATRAITVHARAAALDIGWNDDAKKLSTLSVETINGLDNLERLRNAIHRQAMGTNVDRHLVTDVATVIHVFVDAFDQGSGLDARLVNELPVYPIVYYLATIEIARKAVRSIHWNATGPDYATAVLTARLAAPIAEAAISSINVERINDAYNEEVAFQHERLCSLLHL